MPLTNAYCTLNDVKLAKGISDVVDDTLLTYAINAASRQIDAVCGQRFWQDANVVDWDFDPDNLWSLRLDQFGNAGVSTTTGLVVKTDPAGDGSFSTTLTLTTDYILKPSNAPAMFPARPYDVLWLTGRFFPYSLYRRPVVRVTAKWGWPAIPDAVVQACIIQAGMLAKTKDAPFGVIALGETGAATTMRQRLHPAAAGLLAGYPYTKPGIG